MSESHIPPAAPDEHDAWLHQALRHAPDAAAAPPHALREAILAEARSAVRSGRAPAGRLSFVDQVAAFWSWLARPPVAAGFAGLMAAMLVGMMWWDRPMDEALAPTPARVARSETAPRPAAAPIAADTVPSPSPAVRPTLPAPTTPAPTTPGTIASQRVAAPKPAPEALAEDKLRKHQAPPIAMQSAPPASPFPGTAPSKSEAAARNQAATPALAKKDAETTTAAPSPPIVPPEPLAAAAPAERARSADAATIDAKGAGASGEMAKAAPAQPPRATTTPRDATGALADRLVPAPAPAPQAFAAAPPLREGQAAKERRAAIDVAARPMAVLLGSLASSREPWARPGADGATAPLSAATQAWLISVDAATTGRWQAMTEHSTRLEGSLADDAAALPLSRDGRIAAVVRVEESGVFFQLQPGPAWFAPLPADALARLRASLPSIGR